MTPIKAIREKCLDCCCGSSYEVRLCSSEKCALYPFRLGKNPNIKREYTVEQREEMRQRFAEFRKKKEKDDD